MEFPGFSPGETTIIHETAEGLEADEPLADVHVAVDTAPEVLLAVVHMKHSHSPGTDETVELPDGFPIARLRVNPCPIAGYSSANSHCRNYGIVR